jgi:hypothetical protein
MRPKAGNDIRTRLEELISTKVSYLPIIIIKTILDGLLTIE